MIHIGFTGSQYGMSLPTKKKLVSVLCDIKQAAIFSSAPTCFHHGDCIGSDAVASGIASYYQYLVHAHPQFNEKKRAFSQYNDVIHAPKEPLDRNQEIVDVSRIMIATPHTMNEVIRSGTWATIRYARKLDRELCIIFPDGSYEWENSDRTNGREAS